MSEEQLKAFLEKVKADTSIQEKLKAAADAEFVDTLYFLFEKLEKWFSNK